MITEDPNDPDLRVTEPSGMRKTYLVLSAEERARGWVRPFRDKYIHDKCQGLTRMGRELSETYARDPKFYTGTFCVHCGAHYPVAEFTWENTKERVGS